MFIVMKTLFTLLILCMSSVMSFAQSIQSVFPAEVRRNMYVPLELFGKNTFFLSSTSLTITFQCASDGSVFTATDIVAGTNTYCSGPVRIPATATPGLYNVSITTTNQGTLIKNNAFLVNFDPPFPEISSISPTMAGNGDYVAITISGRYTQFLSASLFISLQGNFNNIFADSFVVFNDTTLEAFFAIPVAASSDTCAVTMTTDFEYVILPSAFIIDGLNPDILSISPNSANNGTHVDITVKTTETMFTVAPIVGVTLQGPIPIFPTSISVTNDTLLVASFDIPQRILSGVFDVALYSNGVHTTEPGAFTINGINPILTGVSPAQGTQGQTMDITVSGTEMYYTLGSTIEFGMYDSSGFYISGTWNSVVVLNDDQIKSTVMIPKHAPTGLYTIFVIVDGDTSELKNAFTLVDDGMPDPILISVNPDTVQRGQLVDITITGSGTTFMQASNIEVFLKAMNGFNYHEAIAVSILNNTQLKCTFNLSAYSELGLFSVIVIEDNNTIPLILEGVVTITRNTTTEPTLVSVSSSMAFPGQQFGLTITGVNTHFLTDGTSSPYLEISVFSEAGFEWNPTDFLVTSNTSITAQFHFPNNLPLGMYHLRVISTIDDSLELKNALIVNAVGVEEEKGLIGNLYPNPVRDKLYIETKQQLHSLTIVDITGKQTILDLTEIKQDPTHLIVPIDKVGLRSGIYFIRLESDNGFDYQKFIVE